MIRATWALVLSFALSGQAALAAVMAPAPKAKSCCASSCPMEKSKGPENAACCRAQEPGDFSRVFAFTPIFTALPAVFSLASAAPSSALGWARTAAPRTHAPPSPTGLSPPALA